MEIEDESQNTKLIIEKLLKSQGIEEYDNGSINCLNEFINSYISDLVNEAKTRMKLSKQEKIDKVLFASIIKQKQYNMYQSKSNIFEMTYLARKLNEYELPPIPEAPVVLKPPVLNNLLRNNFQIYSEELNKTLTEKNNQIKEKEKEINILGNKRSAKDINDNKYIKKEIKNKRKKSVSQENKTSNKKNKSLENKNISNSKNNDSIISSNSINNNEDNFDSIPDESIDENNRESTINKKEEEDSINSEGESEEDKDENNESNNN